MRFIAHRGNWQGSNPDYENKIEYLQAALDKQFDVECDLIGYRGKLYFGHDEPNEIVNREFISNSSVFCHAKNLEALLLLADMPEITYFWHQDDTVTLTSQGHMWCLPGVHPTHKQAIWLDLGNIPLPENTYGIYGICGDKV
jgi:hypothetical protein